MTVAEVAVRMRVSRATIYRLMHYVELPRMRVGRSFAWPRGARDRSRVGAAQRAGVVAVCRAASLARWAATRASSSWRMSTVSGWLAPSRVRR